MLETHEQLAAVDRTGAGVVVGHRGIVGRVGRDDELVERLVEALDLEAQDVADALLDAEVHVGRALG